MDVSFRALYLEVPIALPLAQDCNYLDPPPDWKTMSEASFMEKYGDVVLAKYNLPTEEELTVLYDGQEDTDNQVTPWPWPPLQEVEVPME